MWFWLLLAVWIGGWGFIPQLLLLNKRPTATLAWLWALLLIPVFGLLLYLAIGSERVKRKRMKKRRDFRDMEKWEKARSLADQTWKALSKTDVLEGDEKALFQGLSSITGLPVTTLSGLEVLRNAEAYYDALEKDIRAAKETIHIETYIWREDEVGKRFLDLLIEACGRGVKVRVLVDELGSMWLKRSYFRPLQAAGGEFSWDFTLSPLRGRYSFNLRNHRKLQVIDGMRAYVGGMNFGREYMGLKREYGPWSDVQILVEGTVVEVLQEIFAEDWFFATGREDIGTTASAKKPQGETHFVQVLRGGPDEVDYPMLRSSLALVGAAKSRLWIASGYFVPGETMQSALQVAVARGVDVRLLISRKSEHPLLVRAGRSYYEALLRQGILLYEFSKGIEHSKYMIVDEDLVSVGSSNLDERSMRLNFELSLLVHCAKTNREFVRIFNATIEEAKEIKWKTFSKRPLREKLIESALRPLSPVL